MRLPHSKLALTALIVGGGLTVGGIFASADSSVPPSQESVGAVRSDVGGGRTVPVLDAYGKLPLHFQPNVGQTDSEVKFLARDRGHALFLTSAEAVLLLRKAVPPGGAPSSRESEHTRGAVQPDMMKTGQQPEAVVVRMKFVGADAATKIVGLDELPGKVNYFTGADPARWRRNIPTYARVAYRGLYPGIDLVFYGNQQHLEYDLVLAPGADAGVIALQFVGAERMTVDAEGDLVLQVAGGELRWRKPVIYQELHGVREPVAGGYVVSGPSRVGFRVAAYDVARPLVIDPVLAYSTYLGGASNESAGGITVDGAGSAYVTGWTGSIDFPTASPYQPALRGSADVFVTKLNLAGSARVYSTYLGGDGSDVGHGIAVDGAGNAYLTGVTSSANFPTFNPIYTAPNDLFVAKLNAAGSTLVYSTYLGGSAAEGDPDIAVDGVGSTYVTGWTASTDFPTRNPFQPTSGGGRDAFFAKVNAAGSDLVYSSYPGGSRSESGHDIVVNATGNAYVTGQTDSDNFPTVNPFQASRTPWFFSDCASGPEVVATDAFVTKVATAGSTLVYSTYLGGDGYEEGFGIAVDGAGNAT